MNAYRLKQLNKMEAVRDRADAYAIKQRRNPTPHERQLAGILSGLNYEYEMQHKLMAGGRFWLIDFFIQSLNLAIELHGNHHRGGMTKYLDDIKHSVIREKGYSLEVIWNDDLSHSGFIVKLQNRLEHYRKEHEDGTGTI